MATAKALFSSGGAAADMPSFELAAEDLADGEISIIDILVKSKLCASKSDARRAVEQGGVEAAGEKVKGFGVSFGADALSGEGIVVNKGQKNFCRVVLK